MADTDGADNRTEAPTARRRQQARDEGRIAKSPELAAAAVLLTGAVLLGGVGGRALGSFTVDLFRTSPGWLLNDDRSVRGIVQLLRAVTWRGAVALAPLAGGLAVAAIVVGVAQSRGVVSWKAVTPDWKRVNPIAGFGRILGTEAALNLVKSSLKMVVLGWITFLVFRRAWPRMAALGDAGPLAVVETMASMILSIGTIVGIAFLALGGLDYLVAFFRTEKSLKMSRQEIVQEHREQEGDPHIKARIRQIARQRARQRMLSMVAKADVVVTNPTHIAVALKYDAATGAPPIVLAMGERKLAERIKMIAARAGVSMVENKPLARALLATCSVGAPIPPALYVAVAEILAYVYRRRGRVPTAVGQAALGRRR